MIERLKTPEDIPNVDLPPDEKPWAAAQRALGFPKIYICLPGFGV